MDSAATQVLEQPGLAPAGLPDVAPGGSRLSGVQKATALLVSLGPERAASIFSHLSEPEIETLSLQLAKTGHVGPDLVEAVFEEIVELTLAGEFAASGGMSFAQKVLETAMGPEKAEAILGRLTTLKHRRPFDFLQRMPPEHVAAALRDEAPQTVALILANLYTSHAAQVLAMLPPDAQAEVSMKIAHMGQTSTEIVAEVEDVMRSKLSRVASQRNSATGGVRSLADILNQVDRPTERNVLETLEQTNAELAEEIRNHLFVFEDIVRLDDRSVQLVLREVDTKDLALALRGVPPEVREKVLGNMSQRAKEMLEEEMEIQEPQKRSVVEEAQAGIVGAIRRLEDAGLVTIGREGDEEDDEPVV